MAKRAALVALGVTLLVVLWPFLFGGTFAISYAVQRRRRRGQIRANR